MKKIFKNKKSSQVVMGGIILSIILIVSATTSVIIPNKTSVSAQEEIYEPLDSYHTQASTDYIYHKAITIESNYISNSLTNFPILVHDDTGNLTDNVLANGSDIAFYAIGNSTQYNHEIEHYNSTSGELWAWVNVTSISDSTDTIFYMYYNDSDGSYPVGHNPQDVWDVNFSAVWHMNDASGNVVDSTSNSIDLTAVDTPSYQQSGQIGDCLRFNGGSEYLYESGTFLDIMPSGLTYEAWFWRDNQNRTDTIMCKYQKELTVFKGRIINYAGNNENNNHIVSWFQEADATWHNAIIENATDSEWFYGVSSYKDGGYVKGRLNLIIEENETVWGNAGDGSDYDFSVGAVLDGGPAEMFFDGSLDELRVSNIQRNDSWLNTTYHSQNQTSGFLTLGVQQGQGDSNASIYTLIGLPDNRITWSGTAGTDVWCNSTGDSHETIEVNLTVNASDNVTDIIVNIGNLNDTTQWVNASNITLYVSSDNSSYGYMGTFTDGGSNISINTTTWNAGTMGTNPFTYGGITNKNESIYLRCNLTIPSDITTDTFYSTAADTYKIYITRKV